MTSYTVAQGGERLDRIAKALYGTEKHGTVAALLAANQGLAAAQTPGLTVAAGTVIVAPSEVDTSADDRFVLAWE